MNKKISPKLVALIFAVLVVCFAISFYVFAWTEPTTDPPIENVFAPLNVSPNAQVKIGGLILNTGGSPNGLAVDQGNVGIGTLSPDAKLQVTGGDIYASTAGDGLILKSPDGSTCKRVSIDNAGSLITTVVACP